MLRAKLYDAERTKRDAARAADRRGQIGSGDRSERIRTYNFPQGRVTDHRINLTLYNLPKVMEGEALGEIIDALVAEHQAELLAAEALTMPSAPPAARIVISPGITIESAAARAGRRRFATPASTRRSSTRAFSPATRSASTTARWSPPRHARLGDLQARTLSALAAASSGARAGGAHCRPQGILGPAASHQRRHAGAAAGNRDRGRSGAGGDRRRRIAHRARCASPISAPARARCCWRCLTELPNAPGIGTDVSTRRAGDRARQRAASSVCSRARISSPAISARRSPAASIWWCPIRPTSRATTSRRSRRRSAAIRAARSTAAPTGLTPIAPSRGKRGGCSRPTDISWSSSAWPGSGGLRRCFAAAGLAPLACAFRSIRLSHVRFA